MRVNFETYTGKRSSFICTAAFLLAVVVIGSILFAPAIGKLIAAVPFLQNLSPYAMKAWVLIAGYLLPVLLIVITALFLERKREFSGKLGLKTEEGYSFRSCVISGVTAIVLTLLLAVGLAALLEKFGIEVEEQSLVEFLRTLPFLPFCGFALITVILAPIAEELIFRHVLYRFFRHVLYRKEAMIAVSILFALVHLPGTMKGGGLSSLWPSLVVPVLPLFVLALFLQREYERSRSIIPSVLIHAGYNLTNLVILIISMKIG